MRVKHGAYLFLILILFLLFLLRLPSLFEPNWYGDEGIFAAVGHGINQGSLLYQGTWDNKPPLIYLLYAGVFKIFGPDQFYLRLLAITSALLTAFFIFSIVRKIAGEKRALLATMIFIFLTSTPLLEGNLALTEIFMILPTAAGFFLFLKSTKESGRKEISLLLGAGILLALASLFKQIAVVEAGALGIYILGQRKNLGKIFWLGLGFVLPYATFLLFFFFQGTVKDFIFAAYTYYFIYLKESPSLPLYFTVLKFVPALVMVIYFFYHQKTTNKTPFYFLAYLWLAFALLGVLFSGRPYPHYVLQVVPPLAIVLSLIKLQKPTGFGAWIWAFFILSIVIFSRSGWFNFQFLQDPLRLSYYQNFKQFLTGERSLTHYNNYFDQNVNRILFWKDFLVTQEVKNQEVYIWGDYPWLYVLAGVKNPVRFVTSFHVFGIPGGKEEVIRDLINKKPTIIMRDNTGSIGKFEDLNFLLLKDYREIATIGNAEFFRLK